MNSCSIIPQTRHKCEINKSSWAIKAIGRVVEPHLNLDRDLRKFLSASTALYLTMGCGHSVESEISAVSYPVPFGHVPYTPSLPGAMGPLWDFPAEWWFYAGWATDAEKNRYTILAQTLRFRNIGAILYGVGIDRQDGGSESQRFLTNSAYGSEKFPIPTSKSWQTEFSSSNSKMSCKLTSGTLGLSGAKYNLEMVDNDHDHSVKVKLVFMDNLGMVLEGSLVPRPNPVFQCCTLKNGRAWYAKSRDNLCHAAAWF